MKVSVCNTFKNRMHDHYGKYFVTYMRVVNPISSGVGRICRDQPCPLFVGVLASHDHAIWMKMKLQ